MIKETLYVPGLQPSLKHPTVFKKFDALNNGESFLLVNDHDPIPLFYEMKAERGDVFTWNKIENGPEVWQVEITRKDKASAVAPATNETSQDPSVASEFFELNVTLIEPKLKHPTIFRHFDALKPGEAFKILNDHDPKPLYYQLIAERGNIFTWTYLEKGPQWWRVQIKKLDTESGETVGQIAARDIRKAEVFKKYGIDFCCGGKKSLKEVCEEKGLVLSVIEDELASSSAATVSSAIDPTNWDIDFLADYIYNQHHKFYYKEEPVITGLMEKVAAHHGETHKELINLLALYRQLVKELNTHFMKEEKVVFPFIKAIMQASKAGNSDSLHDQLSLTEPIRIMESDHEAAGDILQQMQELTNGYTAPEGACNSYQFLFKKLKELDEDLHQHIHLENNILFPKSLAAEKQLRKN
jgi:regulator of cell morphogenesis and NO signaling